MLTATNRSNIKISKEIQDYISTEITASIRELVGAINRIVSFSRINNKTPNLAETKVVLKDLLNISENLGQSKSSQLNQLAKLS